MSGRSPRMPDSFWVDYWHMRQREIAIAQHIPGVDEGQRLSAMIREMAPGAWALILAETTGKTPDMPALHGDLAVQLVRVSRLREAQHSGSVTAGLMTLAIDAGVLALRDGHVPAQQAAMAKLREFAP